MNDWFLPCEYCAVEGERVKTLPFGNESGTILFVLPGYLRLDAERQRDYAGMYPEALFVSFTACANVLELADAELFCSVLLRNVARPFYKILISDYEPLKKLFNLKGESATNEDGTKVSVYKGKPDGAAAQEEYKRLLHG